MGGDKARYINICRIDKIVRIIFGVILILISLVFPFVQSSFGKIVVSAIGIVLLLMAIFKVCPLTIDSCDTDEGQLKSKGSETSAG